MPRIETLVASARRRMVWNTVLEQAALAVTAGLAGFIALLVFGSEALDWRWIVVLTGVALVAGLYRTARRIPGPYEVAQRLDRKLECADALSTAWHFEHETRGAQGRREVIEVQRAAAERLAEAVDAARVAPLTFPRTAYAAGMLALVAVSVFGVRYGVRRSLDLRPPIAQFAFDFFAGAKKTEAAEDSKRKELLKKVLEENGIPVSERTERAQLDPLSEAAYTFDQDENMPLTARRQERAKNNERDQPDDGVDDAERSTGDADESDGDDADGSMGTPPPDSSAKPSKKNADEESSLIQKMKEAMANLLEKLKITPPSAGEGERTERASNGSKTSGMKKTSDGGKQMPGKPQADGSQEGQAENRQPSESEDPAAGGKSNRGERGGEERASKEARSGIGREDGEKGLHEAENLAAMGKLSEILGKRSQNLTGEILVEVNSSKQQTLKTQYTNSNAGHSEAGGEIHRDEVPLMHQEFVKQYFEEIRKVPPPKVSGAKP